MMPVVNIALSQPASSRFILAAGLSALLLIPRDSIAQAPGSAPAPSQSERPWPTLTPVSAGPDEVIHVVKKGDTLWDLANAFLKDPFRWPEVFRRNTDIVENPHWIYPGETIRIPSSEVRPEVLARVVTKPAPPSDRTVFSVMPGAIADRIGSSGEVLGRDAVSGVPRGEIEAAPFGARLGGPPGSGRLAAAYDRPGIQSPAGNRRFQLKDRVFVELPSGSAGTPGDLFLAYRLGPQISDASQLVFPTAIVRVESVQPGQLALARVVRQFAEVMLDQQLMPLDDTKPSAGAPIAVPPGPNETVVYVAGDPVLPSLQSYVILTAKAANGVRVGDQYTLVDDSTDPRYPAPAVPAAVAEVVRVTPFAVTAIVVDQEQPRIYAGMIARLSARAP